MCSSKGFPHFKDIHKDYTLAVIALKLHQLGQMSGKEWCLRRCNVYNAERLIKRFKEREKELQSSVYS